jgi:uncharacterized protein with FMN-binding domain
MLGMAQKPSGKKVANSLVALSSAAVLAVYAAGYTRTRSAAAKFESQTNERRPALPAPPANVPATEELQPRVVAPAVRLVLTPAKPEAAPTEAAPPTPDPRTPVPAVLTPEPAPIAEQAPPPPPPVPAPPAAPVWKDGSYTGWGTSRHGDIQASVIIEGGRIASATIAQCLTRYSCSVIEKLPPEVAQRQSPEVDYVSGATQSTNAFYYAVVEALNKAK